MMSDVLGFFVIAGAVVGFAVLLGCVMTLASIAVGDHDPLAWAKEIGRMSSDVSGIRHAQRDYERQRDEYQRTLAEYRSRRETTETGVAWLQAQIKEDACWDRAIPPDDRLVSAVTVGELSIDDARWVRQAAELLKADRQMKLAILDRCTGWASFELAAQMLGVLASGYRHRPGYREEDWKPANRAITDSLRGARQEEGQQR